MVFEIASEQAFGFRDVKQAIEAASLRFLGEFGTQTAHPIVMESMYQGKTGIVRVARGSLNDMKSALVNIKGIQGKEAAIKVIGVSGILKKARFKFLKR